MHHIVKTLVQTRNGLVVQTLLIIICVKELDNWQNLIRDGVCVCVCVCMHVYYMSHVMRKPMKGSYNVIIYVSLHIDKIYKNNKLISYDLISNSRQFLLLITII